MRCFFELSALEQRRAFTQIRDFLAAAAPTDTEADRIVGEQAEALDVLARVAEHLKLPEGRAPTAAAFDDVCRELDLGWTRSRVIRAWGRWRTACAALDGRNIPLTARQLAYYSKFRGRSTKRMPALTALRRFVESAPPKERTVDYACWAREQNERLGEGELLFPSVAMVFKGLPVTWRDALRVARGEVALADVPERKVRRYESWVSGPNDLVSMGDVMKLLGVSRSEADGRAREEEFPAPVVRLGSTRGWLRSDVEAYARGEPVPQRQENELQHQYLDGHDLGRLIGLSFLTIRLGPKGMFPPFTGRLAATKYWLRSDVERWIAANQALVARRLRQQRSRIPGDVERKELVALTDLEALFGVSPEQARLLVGESGFPLPVAHIGVTAIWSRSQIDAYLTQQPLPDATVRPGDVVGSRELSEMSGLPLTTVRTLYGVPPPAGKAGRKNYWWRADIEKWLATRAGR